MDVCWQKHGVSSYIKRQTQSINLRLNTKTVLREEVMGVGGGRNSDRHVSKCGC
jgi:hypothetical protein